MSFNQNQFSVVFLCFDHPSDMIVWVCECVFMYVAPALSLVSMFMVPFNLSCVWLCWWGCGGAGAIYHTAPNALILCSWSSEGSSINIRLTENPTPTPTPLSLTPPPQKPSVNIWASFFISVLNFTQSLHLMNPNKLDRTFDKWHKNMYQTIQTKCH